MYCSCSNKNNYEVISLCDVKKFTEKNGPFNRKLPWTQISIADILMLDCNNLAIEKIEKIYINVSIISTKIIDTPITPSANSEGMTLTGKKLLIDGYICSKIVYTSLTKEQSVYTSKFNVPFCTYIVIDANADIFNDKYCIKTCVEDVFLSLIDCKTIFQNVTLFLFAEKTSITCAMPQIPKDDCTINIGPPPGPPCDEPTIPAGQVANIPSIIVSLDTANNVVGQVSFLTDIKKLQVFATSNKPSETLPHNAYFLFKLRDCNKNIKAKSVIKSEEIGTTGSFVADLGNKDFKYGDIIELELLLGRKANIIDFPQRGQTRILGETAEIGVLIKEFYKINYDGLKPFNPNPPIVTPSLPNVIRINDLTNNPLISIGFDIEDNMLISTARNVSIDRNTNPPYTYVNFKLTKPNGTTVVDVPVDSLRSVLIQIQNLIKLLFDFGDIIELTYSTQARPNVTIANLQGADHKPTTNSERYRITPTGLVKIS